MAASSNKAYDERTLPVDHWLNQLRQEAQLGLADDDALLVDLAVIEGDLVEGIERCREAIRRRHAELGRVA